MLPGRAAEQQLAARGAAPEARAGAGAGIGLTAAGLLVGAHAGLALAFYGGRTARRAEGAAPTKYVESAAEARLFEQIYRDYTAEYLKGPLYFDEDKMIGWEPEIPGAPVIKNAQVTSNALVKLKNFSSNELAFLSVLFFGIGLYGNIMFNFVDPQWANVAAHGLFNISYVVESLFLPVSFVLHIGSYIQRKNGK